MLAFELVEEICNLARQMKLWNTPQELQQLVETLLDSYKADYQQIVVMGNIQKASIWIVQEQYVHLVSPAQTIEACLDLYQMKQFGWKKYKSEYAEVENSIELTVRLQLPKILLINICNTSLRPIPRLNLSTAALASYLRYRGKAIVQILDMQFGVTLEEVETHVKEFEPKIVGLSVDFMEYEVATSVIRRIQRIDASIQVVLGNVLPALLPDKFLHQFKNIIISYGEGEESLCDIVAWQKGEKHLEDVSGIIYKRQEKIQKTPIRYINMEDCQTPALDTAVLLQKYRGVLTLETSRGCDYAKCTFCPREHKTRFWRCLSVEQVLEQIEDILQVSHELQLPNHIYFADEEMIGELPDGTELERIMQICENISQKYKDVHLDIAVRADSIYNPRKGWQYNLKMLQMWKLIKKAGADRIFIGIESGCEQQLKRYNKGTTPIQNVIAIRILTALGMQVRLGFVMFDPLMPGLDELQENIQFLERTDAVLIPVAGNYTDEELLKKIESDSVWIQEQKVNIELYNYVSYLMTGLEVFVNAPYAKMIRQYEQKEQRTLIYGYDWELGKLQVKYINPQIENIYRICCAWVKKNYSVTYTLKSLRKSATEVQKEQLEKQLYQYRKCIFGFAKELIHVSQSLDNEIDDIDRLELDGLYQQENHLRQIYMEWVQHVLTPYMLELLRLVETGVISDTENHIFKEVLNVWLQNPLEGVEQQEGWDDISHLEY